MYRHRFALARGGARPGGLISRASGNLWRWPGDAFDHHQPLLVNAEPPDFQARAQFHAATSVTMQFARRAAGHAALEPPGPGTDGRPR
jgi:hypothetical protein